MDAVTARRTEPEPGDMMQAADVRRQYATQTVATGNPAQLVLMMYEAAVGAVESAEVELGASDRRPDVGLVNRELIRAQKIITELEVSLDHESGGAIAASLQSIYVYARQRLIDANVSKNPASLPEVKEILRGLRDAWAEGVLESTAS